MRRRRSWAGIALLLVACGRPEPDAMASLEATGKRLREAMQEPAE